MERAISARNDKRDAPKNIENFIVKDNYKKFTLKMEIHLILTASGIRTNFIKKINFRMI